LTRARSALASYAKESGSGAKAHAILSSRGITQVSAATDEQLWEVIGEAESLLHDMVSQVPF